MAVEYIVRDAERLVQSKLDKHPVVLLTGARLVGTTTLAKRICETRGAMFHTLELLAHRRKLLEDPQSVIGDGSRFTVIDGIQLMPEEGWRGIMDMVDSRASKRGNFLLSGSIDRASLREVGKSLKDRISFIMMRPFSRQEITAAEKPQQRMRDNSARSNVIESLEAGIRPPDAATMRIAEAVGRGGFPTVLNDNADLKHEKMIQYAEVELTEAPFSNSKDREGGFDKEIMIMRKLSECVGEIRNMNSLVDDLPVTKPQATNLVEHLTNTFVLEPLPSLGDRLRERRVLSKERMYFIDSGIPTSLLGLDGKDLRASPYWGRLLENFVLAELRKHLELSSLASSGRLCYFKEDNGIEIDVVLSLDDNSLYAFEIESTSSISVQQWNKLAKFREIAGYRFRKAIILYCGSKTLVREDGIEAWPISFLLRHWK